MNTLVRFNSSKMLASIVAISSILGYGTAVQAQTTYTWDRGAATNDFNTPANWSSDTVPTIIDTTAFNAATTPRQATLSANTLIRSLAFQSGNWTVDGAFTLSFNGSNNATINNIAGTTNTISTTTLLINTGTELTYGSGSNLIVNSVMNVTTSFATAAGSGTGTVTLAGAASNVFTNANFASFQMRQGTLILAKTGTASALAGGSTTGSGNSGTFAPCTSTVIRYSNAVGVSTNQIGDFGAMAYVGIGNGALLDLNGQSDRIRALAFATGVNDVGQAGGGGNVSTGVGVLDLSEGSTASAVTGATGISPIIYRSNGTTQGTTTANISGNLLLSNARVKTVDVTRGADASGVDVNISATLAATGGAISKVGTGVLRFSGATANTATVDTQVLGGTLQLAKTAGVAAIAGGNITVGDNAGASEVLLLINGNQIVDGSNLTLNGGTLLTNGNDETLGTLSVLGGASIIDFGKGDSDLFFADSSATTFSGTLGLLNFNDDVDSFFAGVNNGGLTSAQLAQISFVNPTIGGVAQTGNFAASIGSNGALSAVASVVPESGAFALLAAGLPALLVVRRRKVAL